MSTPQKKITRQFTIRGKDEKGKPQWKCLTTAHNIPSDEVDELCKTDSFEDSCLGYIVTKIEFLEVFGYDLRTAKFTISKKVK